MGKKQHCLACNKELGFVKYTAKKGWDIQEGSLLCWKCWNNRETAERKVKEQQDNAERMVKLKEKVVKYEGEFITVVEIPVAGPEAAWSKVDELVKKGYTIKAVIEKEYWKTSLVVLEKLQRK
jgi:hypothetical protein